MNNIAVEDVLHKYSKYFKTFDIDELRKYSKKINLHSISKLKLYKVFFRDCFDYENSDTFMIAVVVRDKVDNSIVYHDIKIRKVKKDNNYFEINIDKIQNSKSLNNYNIDISVIPLINKNIEFIKIVQNAFVRPIKFFRNKIVIKNKIEKLTFMIVLFSIFFTISQFNIYNVLIEKYGFFESLIDNFAIASSIFSYIISYLDKTIFWFILLLYVLLSFLFFLPIIAVLIVETLMMVFNFIKDDKDKQAESSVRIRYQLKDLIVNFQDYINLDRIISIILFIALGILSILIFSFNFLLTDKDEIFNYENEIVEKYLKQSYFPNVVDIQKYDGTSIEVVMIGYDEEFSYYLTYENMMEILNENVFSNIPKTKKEDYEKIPIHKIYARYLKGIDNSIVQLIKNREYKTITRVNKPFYILKSN